MTYRPLEKAEDIVQDCFMRVFERWDSYQTATHVRASLYMYIRNACISDIRHENVKACYERTANLSDSVIMTESIERELEWHETYRLLLKAIDNLPMQGRRVIQLSLEGLSNKEIADELGLSLNTVKLYKKNAYKKLRKDIEEAVDADTSYLYVVSFILWSLQSAM